MQTRPMASQQDYLQGQIKLGNKENLQRTKLSKLCMKL